MRIAVCLSGAERLQSDAVTHFARNLPADAEIDCFCFFWEGGPLSDEAALTELVVRKTEGRFRSVEVTVGRNFQVDFDLTVMKYPETNVENVIRMYRGIKRCNDMKLKREVEGGFVYDHVIRTRADLQISSVLDLGKFMPLTREFVVFPENGHWRGGLNDQFAFGSSAMMDTYSSVIDYIPEHCGQGCPFHPETLLRFHLTRMQIYPILAPISAMLVRG
jgi:hypothetical protein